MAKKTILIILTSLFILMGAAGAWAVQFPHETHTEVAQADCRVCHKADALSIVPDGKVCDDCHPKGYMDNVEIRLETHDSFWYADHKKYARLEGSSERNAQCVKCHTESFCLDCHKGGFPDELHKANIHRSDYRVTHPIMARGDSRSCASCHESRFCVDCHNRFSRTTLRLESHRRSWSDLQAGAGGPTHENFEASQCEACHPDSFLPTRDWSEGHAREARRDLHLCQNCHEDADVCLKCHSARTGLRANPHPSGWDGIKGNYDDQLCKKCHD